ncbi:MAG: dephospho-CoA kinase [Nanoarchaeota archaeon]
MIIVITGKQGAGKSTVARQLASHGLKVIDADIIGHALLREPNVKARLAKSFGRSILAKGAVSRKKLSAIVFSDDKKRLLLNRIIHPLLRKKIAQAAAAEGDCIIDAALFQELRLANLADLTVLVQRSLYGERARVQKNIKSADIILDNSGSLKDLKKKSDALWQSIQAASTR